MSFPLKGFLRIGVCVLLAASVFAAPDTTPRSESLPELFARIAPEPVPVTSSNRDYPIPEGGHFQGIQETVVDGKRFAVISGSSDTESYLVVLDLSAETPQPLPRIPLMPRPFKHAGGFQIAGNFLAVGIEDDKRKDTSRIWIIDTASLTSGKAVPRIEIKRQGAPKRATAGAVGMAHYKGRHLLVVGTWDSATIDFYTSNGKPLKDPGCSFRFLDTWVAIKADRSDWSDPRYGSYQNLNLVADEGGGLFLVGFARTGIENHADLFVLDPESASLTKRLRKIGTRTFRCRQSDFRSGAGLSRDESGKLRILACGHRQLAIERFE